MAKWPGASGLGQGPVELRSRAQSEEYSELPRESRRPGTSHSRMAANNTPNQIAGLWDRLSYAEFTPRSHPVHTFSTQLSYAWGFICTGGNPYLSMEKHPFSCRGPPSRERGDSSGASLTMCHALIDTPKRAYDLVEDLRAQEEQSLDPRLQAPFFGLGTLIWFVGHRGLGAMNSCPEVCLWSLPALSFRNFQRCPYGKFARCRRLLSFVP